LVADHLDTDALLRIIEGHTERHDPLRIAPSPAGRGSVGAVGGGRF
jgi:hypothetical protein